MLSYDRKELGYYLKDARENAQLTQNEVAEKLGYSSAQFISNIERGVSVVPLRTLANMIRLYDVDDRNIIGIFIKGQEKVLKAMFKKNKGSRYISG
ncbi:MAG TPA: helix-turn-helix transcriptional regulator [Bdellovibrionales bacterium]|nr:helix-turn-helix transcriptional regulator [Bdellovibrionales bacterium]